MRTLEARVGAALFVRTTRSVGLTEAGERFLARAEPAFDELVAAGEVARDLGQRPAGLLRLTVPRAVVPLILEPLIASFCQAYPEIEVEIAASDEMVDLAAGGFDAGIRLGQFIAPDMVARAADAAVPARGRRQPRLSAPRSGRRSASTICASTRACACAARTGRSRPGPLSTATRPIEAIVSGPLIAHDYPTLLGAAIQGVGLAQVPGPLAKAPIADGRLQALLARFAVTTPGVFLYHPGKRQVLPKLRAFIEHIKRQGA